MKDINDKEVKWLDKIVFVEPVHKELIKGDVVVVRDNNIEVKYWAHKQWNHVDLTSNQFVII